MQYTIILDVDGDIHTSKRFEGSLREAKTETINFYARTVTNDLRWWGPPQRTFAEILEAESLNSVWKYDPQNA